MRDGRVCDIVWYVIRYDTAHGTVWYGMVWIWYGMVWNGMVWYGMVWYGMVWYGTARYDMREGWACESKI